MMIFETHAHYDDEAFDEDREALLSSMGENQIGHIVNIGSDLESCRRTIALTMQYPFIYGTLGVHPSEVACLSEEHLGWMREQAALEKIVAIGEIGLDYYWEKEDAMRERQKYWFRRQLGLARDTGLPVVIHSRDSAKDTLELMKEERAGEIGGVVHCFSYAKEMAREYLDMGMYLGVGGVVTFKNAKKLREAVAYMPLDRILLETDCPYLAPTPVRGQRNTSLNLRYIAEEIAAIKDMKYEEVVEQTMVNAKRMYRIDG